MEISERLRAINFYPGIAWKESLVFTETGKPLSAEFSRRLCRSYQLQVNEFAGHGNSGWSNLNKKNWNLHEWLIENDIEAVQRVTGAPVSTNLFYGFESFVIESIGVFKRQPEILADEISIICDRIVRLAEALEAGTLWYPEASLIRREPADLAGLLATIEGRFGAEVRFPNPFADEFGISTSRGTASYRAIQALYQAKRLRDVAETYGRKVVEIGGGLGRNVYYANRLGLTDYTVVDLPIGTIAQAVFVGHVLGEGALTLPGETRRAGIVRIITPSEFLRSGERFGVVLNVDSMVEMDAGHAAAYAAKSMQSAGALLSINHEFNAFRVCDLDALQARRLYRQPYWMRKGYVEELYIPSHSRRASWIERLIG